MCCTVGSCSIMPCRYSSMKLGSKFKTEKVENFGLSDPSMAQNVAPTLSVKCRKSCITCGHRLSSDAAAYSFSIVARIAESTDILIVITYPQVKAYVIWRCRSLLQKIPAAHFLDLRRIWLSQGAIHHLMVSRAFTLHGAVRNEPNILVCQHIDYMTILDRRRLRHGYCFAKAGKICAREP